MHLNQPQAIRTIFFDVGLTLLHAYPSDLDICCQVCARLGLSLQQRDLETQWVEAENFFLQHMRVNRHIWASAETIREFWIMYYMKMLRPLAKEQSEKHLRELARLIVRE